MIVGEKDFVLQQLKKQGGLAEDFKIKLHETHPIESDVLVPNCIYRMGCPEFNTCKYVRNFIDWAEKETNNAYWWTDIQTRYDLYNKYFYKNHQKDIDKSE